MSKKSGFTLVEVLIASLILAGTLAIILGVFSQGLRTTETAGEFIKAINAARLQLEMIRARVDPNDVTNTIGFSSLNQWNNQSFTLNELGSDFAGVSYVTSITAPINTWRVKVAVCWRNSKGNIRGEDADLDGVLDSGEDKNGNGELDSPAQLVTVLVEGGV